jgi:hypothetical protein
MHLCRLQLTRLKTLLPRDTALIIESMKFAIGQPRLFILLYPQPQHNLEPLLDLNIRFFFAFLSRSLRS